LVDSEKKAFYNKTSALAQTTLRLNEYCESTKDSHPIPTYEQYHKAYFDEVDIMYKFDKAFYGSQGEFAYYSAQESLLRHYFSSDKGFSIESQSKSSVFYKAGESEDDESEDDESKGDPVSTKKDDESKGRPVSTKKDDGSKGDPVSTKKNKTKYGIRDFCVKIIDPEVYKDSKKFVGLNAEGRQSDKDYYDQVHTMVECKCPGSSGKQQWLPMLAQLKGYHLSSAENTNSFSICMDGSRIAFFMFIENIHRNYVNKSSTASGFLCLHVTKKGVEIVPQKDTFAPQIV
jgi:hypothetical protein